MGPTLFVDISYNSGVVCIDDNLVALQYWDPVIEGQYYGLELQNIDVEPAFWTGPTWTTRNLRIPHVGTPALGRSVRENRELNLERLDRDSWCEKW